MTDTDTAGTERTVATDPYRPAYHVTPSSGWMNDPNGMVYYDGEYHLFYQYNPDDTRWGNVHWGHATSEDLVTWEDHGAKLAPEDGVLQFSGGAAVDERNTAGFGENALVVAYTGHHVDSGVEDQRLAYSDDRGETVTKYDANPVLPSETGDFRDPNVFRYGPDESWRLVVSRVQAADDRPVGIEIYSSENLRNWTYESTYEQRYSHDADMWECPDLYELSVDGGSSKWVLTVSADGERVDHLIGSFDGSVFSLDRRVVADHGFDFYAAMSWANEPRDRRLSLAWMNNWSYAEEIPGPGWRGTQTFPRRVTLSNEGSGMHIRQRPAEEITEFRNALLGSFESELITPDVDPVDDADVRGRCLDIVATIDPGEAERTGLTVRKGEGQRTTVSYQAASGTLLFDRTASGEFFGDGASGSTSAPLDTLSDGTIELRLLVDRSSVEVFANDGRLSMSNLVFPDWHSTGVSLFADGGDAELVSLDVWELTTGQ